MSISVLYEITATGVGSGVCSSRVAQNLITTSRLYDATHCQSHTSCFTPSVKWGHISIKSNADSQLELSITARLMEDRQVGSGQLINQQITTFLLTILTNKTLDFSHSIRAEIHNLSY